MTVSEPTGDELVRILATLANPHRLRVIAALARERMYVSELARALGISRALLQVHLRKLEAAGLVTARLEVSEDGKAMKFYEVSRFTIELTPEAVEAAERTLTVPGNDARQEAVRHETTRHETKGNT
ncbi:metalloregulator ArsR/SmtB family transcription factor [Streptomyces sp. NPDC048636]|uniref:ArsR/SmtB family transcription factor n=1 Tax=Streptomyces sp. NPDC048636 TaxID=3155762 RepID=UPI00344AFB79